MMKLIQINVMKVWGMPKVNQVLRMALISLNILINMPAHMLVQKNISHLR
jgi:hypothetical protein